MKKYGWSSFIVMFLGCLSLIGRPSAVFAQADDMRLKKEVEELKKRLSDVEKNLNNPPRTEAAPAEARVTVPQTKSAPFPEDFTWLNGNSRVSKPMIDNDWFTSQFMVDVNYTYDMNHPKDHTIDGSCEVGRSNEFQVQQLGIGGDLHYGNIRGRLMTQFGMYSQMTPRNDSSPSRGQWLNNGNPYQYIAEGNAGYHFDVMHGVNVDAGIFMSYVGLFSYYQNENWAYQPSYVSANTPWFFNGVRVQTFPTEHLKIEYWLINGWQSYGMFNENPGLGGQILYRPRGWISMLSNNYWGYDTLGNPARQRFHTDNSIEIKYYDHRTGEISKAAFSVTLDAGCESGGGVSCAGVGDRPKQDFLGYMIYNRVWFHQDKFAATIGGGGITNPGRYLALMPPVNGATAASGTPFFTQNRGDSFKAWDYSFTGDYMPNQYITWRAEFNHRASNVPYFAGPGGMTPPGGNTGAAGSNPGTGWVPDLVRAENRITLAMLVRL